MSWCLLMLASHPEIQNKAREEILSVIDSTSGLSYDNIDRLEYCGYVVRETLRYVHSLLSKKLWYVLTS